jgi:hypothetical protein
VGKNPKQRVALADSNTAKEVIHDLGARRNHLLLMAGVNEQPLQLGGGEFGVSTFGEEFQDERPHLG